MSTNAICSTSPDLALNRLPTYDCKGSIFVKFSASQSILDVVYQHMPVHREQNLVPMKRSREDGLEADDSSMAMDIDPTPAHPPPQQYAPRFSLAAPPAPDTDDQTSASRTKRRKRSSQKQTYKDVSSSDLRDESSLNGLSTPEVTDEPEPAHLLTSRDAARRRDWPTSPPRSPDHPLFGDDRAFLGPSVVTRVPSLPAQLRQASAPGGRSFGRASAAAAAVGSDADDNSAAASSSAHGGAAKGPRRRPAAGSGKARPPAASKDAAAAAAAAARDGAASSAAASDSAGKKRTKTGCT